MSEIRRMFVDGSSAVSWSDAAANALTSAKAVLPNCQLLRVERQWADVADGANGAITTYHVTITVDEVVHA